MSRKETVFEPGEVVAGRYEVAEELGRGSYGVVYRAEQLGIGRDVALKTLLPETPVGSEEHQRFEREALVVSRFNHPNIVTLFDYGEHDGVLFMVMEYVQGRDLGEIIDDDAPLEPDRVRYLATQMLDALQYAHDKKVVHRDLKPENIQVLRNPSMQIEDPELVKVLDFGIAKFVHGDEESAALDTLTQTGTAMGTPRYMSPENISGDPVRHHADLYAVGLLIYEMLTGEVAFTGETPHEVMVSHIKDPAPELPGDPAMDPFRRAVRWALEKQPDDRVPTARAFREVLAQDAPEGEGDAEESAAPPPADDRQLIKPLVAVAAAMSVVVLLLVVVVVQGGVDSGDSGDDGEPTTTERVVADGGDEGAGDDPTATSGDDEVQPGEETGEGDVDDDEVAAAPDDETSDDQDRDDEQEIAEADDEPEIVDDAESPPPEPGPESESVVEADPEADNEPDDSPVVLEITSDPESARVTIDGRPVGTTPVEIEVPRGGEELELGFSHMGYDDTIRSVVPDSDQTVEVTMERGRLQLD